MNIQAYLQSFTERLQIQRYSPSSIKNYNSNLFQFLTIASNKYASAEKIEISVAAAGYDTEHKEANAEAYKKLDECCQYERKKKQ